MKRVVLLGVPLLGLSSACQAPSVGLPDSAGQVGVTFEPGGTPDAAPASLRARLDGATGFEPWLFRGDVSEHHERLLRRGELPNALGERAVPLRFWSEALDLFVQPLDWLEADERYTLALRGYGTLEAWHVTGDRARAERLFPAPGRPVQRAAAYCSADFGAELPPLQLAPGDVALVPLRLDETCVAFVAEQELAAPALLPPSHDGVLLPPSTFAPAPVAPSPPPECRNGEERFGACVEVLDDRVRVTALEQDLLWLVDAPAPVVVVASLGRRATLLSKLAPQSTVVVRGTVLGSNGRSDSFELELETMPASPHLVLSEVMANPAGPEPASEWVELVNDGQEPVDLSGLWLEDSTQRSSLPEARLDPGQAVLLVARGFRPSALDVAVSADVRYLELDALGGRGLSNSGEGLLLVGPNGVVSRFPALAAARAGRSLARRSLDSADDDASAFAEHGDPGASPGAPNSFD